MHVTSRSQNNEVQQLDSIVSWTFLHDVNIYHVRIIALPQLGIFIPFYLSRLKSYVWFVVSTACIFLVFREVRMRFSFPDSCKLQGVLGGLAVGLG